MEQLTPDGRNAFKLSLVGGELSHLLGEVLTIIDAATEGEKNKALKDLIKRSFNVKQVWFADLAWKQEESENEGHGPHAEWEAGLVPCDVSKKYGFK